MTISALEPRQRGFAFERFLNELLDFYDLAPRGSFRLVGEQIDGSFRLDGHTYLLEAKWQNAKVGRSELDILNTNVTRKAAWSRGLFVSYSGFTDDGLEGFGHGLPTSIICLNGYDLWEILDRQLNLPDVIRVITRRAAETGACYTSVRSLL